MGDEKDEDESDQQTDDEVIETGSRRSEDAEEEAEEQADNAAWRTDPVSNATPVGSPGSVLDQPQDAGVTLDFRKSRLPGAPPRRFLARNRLIEVDEAIIDVPERVTIQVPRSDAATMAGAEQSHVIEITPGTCPCRCSNDSDTDSAQTNNITADLALSSRTVRHLCQRARTGRRTLPRTLGGTAREPTARSMPKTVVTSRKPKIHCALLTEPRTRSCRGGRATSVTLLSR